MKKVIFNADDFALAVSVNNGIIKAFKEGVVKSTSLMANTPIFLDSIYHLKENATLDIGVHLNLTYYKPLTKAKTLIDKHGFFKRPFNITNLSLKEIEDEFKAQIERVLSAGLTPTHLDTHHHIHKNFDVLNIIIKLSKIYKLAVRFPSYSVKTILQKSNIKTTDNFISDFYADKVKLDNLKKILLDLQDGITEFCVHPGMVSDYLIKNSSYTIFRQMELEIYISKELKEFLALHNIEVISWKDI